jgi:hypothetical protein
VVFDVRTKFLSSYSGAKSHFLRPEKFKNILKIHLIFNFRKSSEINKPVLILQTDLDGLVSLKQSSFKKRFDRLNEKLKSRETNLSDPSFSISSDNNESDMISNFSFDACEISELRITSV